MGKVVMNAAVSLDGFVAMDDDLPGPIFDWYGNGPVAMHLGDEQRVFHVSPASAGYLAEVRDSTVAGVIEPAAVRHRRRLGRTAASGRPRRRRHPPPRRRLGLEGHGAVHVRGQRRGGRRAGQGARGRQGRVDHGRRRRRAGAAARTGRPGRDEPGARRSSAAASRSSAPARSPRRSSWRTRGSSSATGSRTWCSTSAATGRANPRTGPGFVEDRPG